MRDNMVRLSDEELEAVERIRTARGQDDAAIGKIIGDLADSELDEPADQKLIIITGEGRYSQYSFNISRATRTECSSTRARVVSVPAEPKKLRGYHPDLIALTTPVDTRLQEGVIGPMVSSGSQLVPLYK